MSAELESLLREDEHLGEPFPVKRGDHMWAHGYKVYPVEKPYDGSRPDSNTVIYDIDDAGSTEMLEVVGPIAMQVTALKGLCLAVVYRRGGVRAFPLMPGGEAVEIRQGDVYYYRSIGVGRSVLRDDCTPPFCEGDEVTVLDDPAARQLDLPIKFFGPYQTLAASELPVD